MGAAKIVPSPARGQKIPEEDLNARWEDDGSFEVQSSNGVDYYTVFVLDSGGLKCECPWYERASECKHCRRAVYLMRIVNELMGAGKAMRSTEQEDSWHRFTVFDFEFPEFYEAVMTPAMRKKAEAQPNPVEQQLVEQQLERLQRETGEKDWKEGGDNE